MIDFYAGNLYPIRHIQFKNLIQTEEECIEWHSIYEDEDMNTWKFDMIHIRKGSKYDGVVERATAAITNRLTPEIKQTILQIKFDALFFCLNQIIIVDFL